MPVRVVDARPPRHLRVEAAGGGFRGAGDLLVAVEELTEVRYRFDFRSSRPWLRPVDAVLSTAGRNAGKQRLADAGDRLARLAGGEPGPHEV